MLQVQYAAHCELQLCCAVHCRYYLNGVDAFRLKLLLPLTQQQQDEIAARELERLSLSNGGNAAAEPTNPGGTHVEQQHVQAPDPSSQHAQEHTAEGQSQQGSQSQKDADSSLLQKFDALTL